MRIGIDISFWLGADNGGVSTYALGLLGGLARVMDKSDELVVFLDAEFRPALPAGFCAEVRYVRRPRRLLDRGIQKAARWISMRNTPLVRALEQAGLDIVHLMVPRLEIVGVADLAVIVTVHDVLFERNPSMFQCRELANRRKALARTIQYARAFVAVSNETACDILRQFPAAAERLHVIHSAAGAQYCVRPAVELKAIRAKYGLPEAYVYYPANDWPHKNHEHLLKAWSIVMGKEEAQGVSLVLSGARTPAGAEIDALIRTYGVGHSVVHLGYVPFDDVPLLYNGALALVYPSLFEGFGLPLLEAMRCGCPVVCSDIPVLREVGGDGAAYFNPLEVNSIAEALLGLLQNAPSRKCMVERGMKHQARFTWEEAAHRVYMLYRAAVGNSEGVAP